VGKIKPLSLHLVLLFMNLLKFMMH